MSPALANFLFETANFLVLAGALGWLLFKPVRAALDAERDRHGKAEEETTALRRETETLAEEARQAHARLESDLERRKADSLSAVQREAARIKEEARQSRANQLRALEHEGEAARREQAALLAETIGRIAGASVRHLLETFDGPSLDVALVRGVCKHLATLPEQARTAAVVESARPLDAAARDLLRAALGDSFAERAAPDLGAGVRVTTSVGQVDGSALGLARQAARDVTEIATWREEADEHG